MKTFLQKFLPIVVILMFLLPISIIGSGSAIAAVPTRPMLYFRFRSRQTASFGTKRQNTTT